MTDPLKKKIRTRVAHKAYVTKTLGDIKKNEENLKPEERAKIINLKSSLEEQYEAIKALDNDWILDLFSDKEGVEDEEINTEIEEAGRLRADIKTAIATLDELLRNKDSTENTSTQEKEMTHQTSTQIHESFARNFRNLKWESSTENLNNGKSFGTGLRIPSTPTRIYQRLIK